MKRQMLILMLATIATSNAQNIPLKRVQFNSNPHSEVTDVMQSGNQTKVVFDSNASTPTIYTKNNDGSYTVVNYEVVDTNPYTVILGDSLTSFYVGYTADQYIPVSVNNQTPITIPEQTIIPITNFITNGLNFKTTVLASPSGYVGKYFTAGMQIAGTCDSSVSNSTITLTSLDNQDLSAQNVQVNLLNASNQNTTCDSNNGSPTQIVVDSSFYK